jgi:hypothetical protein
MFTPKNGKSSQQVTIDTMSKPARHLLISSITWRNQVQSQRDSRIASRFNHKPKLKMITLKPVYTHHSTYLGVTIYKRKSGTGTHGGMWKTAQTMFGTLDRAKKYLDHLKSIDCLPNQGNNQNK